MHLQESGEMYIESIYILNKKIGHVRSIDVCEYLGYSKPSVSRAMSLLKNGGFVLTDETVTNAYEAWGKRENRRSGRLQNRA